VGDRAFVRNPDNHLIPEEQRTLIEQLLLERISLRGIGRRVGIGLGWLLPLMVEQFPATLEPLHGEPPAAPR
jgi:hypothetical protein